MKRSPLLGVLCLLSALFPLAGPAAAGELRYVGSSTIGRFIADAASVYGASTFDIHLRPESLGGERCPALGTCDLGGVARELSTAARNNGVVGTRIGRDAIAVIVHPDNPVRELSVEQVRGLFTGEIRNWGRVGGLRIPVVPYIVDWNSATRKVFRDALLEGAEYRRCEVVTPDPGVIRKVAGNIGAVGQISASFLTGREDVRAVRVGGQLPEPGNAAYPAMRPLYLTTRGPPRGEARAFLRWALGAEGQAVVTRRFSAAP